MASKLQKILIWFNVLLNFMRIFERIILYHNAAAAAAAAKTTIFPRLRLLVMLWIL
jgi:hypothetical protein